jgi:flavin reductase (DIM6/NTAB) family NADH-FMN oxidoreductase RutF
MTETPATRGAPYDSGFYPMHLGLLSVATNVMPIAWWTPISKAPFRFLLAIDRKNHSLDLVRARREAVLHFLPFDRRAAVIRAGYVSGRRVRKIDRIGFRTRTSATLRDTVVIEDADAAFELALASEIEEPLGDHVPFVFDVTHVHRVRRPASGRPLLFLGWRDFATLGDRDRFRP